MELQFVKLSPTQNMTILVESPVSREMQPRVAAALMDYGHLYAEQVGYMEPAADPAAAARLQMAGGEFCGNATLSLAAFLSWREGMAPGAVAELPLEVSGAEGLLTCRVLAREDHFAVSVAMPKPRLIANVDFLLDGEGYRGTAVHLPGIVHVVLPVEGLPEDRVRFAEAAIGSWADQFPDYDAFGLLLLDEAAMRMEPLIWVRSSGTLVWERGCGSGSAAVGAALAHKAGAGVAADVTQPGGCIRVTADWANGAVSELSIAGDVRVVARGTAYL